MEVILLIKEDRQLKILHLHINELLKKDLYKEKQIKCCPICDSSEYIKYGSYNGIQRYKCKDCGKTFSKTTNSLWSYLKHSPSKWIEFVELMLEKKSLRFCAAKLNINLTTAFYWRHKVLNGLNLESVDIKLKGDIYIGKTLIKENFKGCRNIITSFRSNLWVVGARGVDDLMIVKPISKGNWNLKRFNEKIYSKIEKNSYIIPYGDRYISSVAKSHNNKLIKKTNNENRIMFLRSNLNRWLKSFRGIATKYLEEYLSLFILFNLDKVIDYMDLINYLSLGYGFIGTKAIGTIKDSIV
jgi:transposase-like protein